jgi:hypothetical protein
MIFIRTGDLEGGAILVEILPCSIISCFIFLGDEYWRLLDNACILNLSMLISHLLMFDC